MRILATLLLASVFLPGCTIFDPVATEEKARIACPDGRVEAVLEERDAGATTSLAFAVYIVPVGDSVSESNRVVVVDRVANFRANDRPTLAWKTDNVLAVEYSLAQVFIHRQTIRVADRDYRVDLPARG